MSGDGGHKLLIADSSISVLVSIVDHLVNLLGSESLTNQFAHLLELVRAEAVGVVGIEHFVELLETGFGLGFTLAEDFNESLEVEFISSGGGLNNANDVPGISLKIQSLDGVDNFRDGDLSTSIGIEEVEHFLELQDGFGVHVLVGVLGGVEGDLCGGASGGNCGGFWWH